MPPRKTESLCHIGVLIGAALIGLLCVADFASTATATSDLNGAAAANTIFILALVCGLVAFVAELLGRREEHTSISRAGN